MTVVFGYGKLHQAMFGDQLGAWVLSKRKKRLSRQNKEMSRWNPRASAIINTISSHDFLGNLIKFFLRAQERAREQIAM